VSLRIALSVLVLSTVPAVAFADPLAASTPETATSATKVDPSAGAPGKAAAKPEEKKICKRMEGATGSRTSGGGSEKVCLTKQQWRQLERAS
jgi:hypothetical protein